MAFYLGALQLCFALTWTVYVIYLPSLAAQAGLGREWVPFILLLDQLVFALSDWAVGTASDRIAGTVGKLGRIAALATLVSCGAFIVLPHVAGAGAAALIGVTLVWTIASSALRAPPFVLIGKYVPAPRQPWLSAASLFGLGLAGAAGPYLALVLKGVDPRIPFAVSSIVLALVTAGMARAERSLAEASQAADAVPSSQADATSRSAPASLGPPARGPLLLAALLAALAFQIHFPLNAASQFLKVAPAGELPWLMPLFWVGFNVMILPAALWTTRFGAATVMTAGAMAGAIASAAIALGVDLAAMAALQIVAGAGWGALLMSAFAAALAAGHTGAEGKVTGAMFSLFALAALMRIGILAAQLNLTPGMGAVLSWAPAVLWTAAGLLLWRAMAAGRNG